jgi:hypothetical protein
MRAAIFLTTVLTAALSACQPSILPYYSITDVTSLPGLVGIWEPADGEEETWAITGDSSRYDIIHKTPERIKVTPVQTEREIFWRHRPDDHIL